MHHKPVVVDETFHIALAIKYAIAFAWAVASYTFGLRTISLVAGPVIPWYETAWTLAVAVGSLTLVASLWLQNERIEAWLTGVWVGLVLVYPICSAILWLSQGDTSRAPLTFLGLSFLVLPVWKLTFLIRKYGSRGF